MRLTDRPRFFGLLHLADDEKTSVNLSVRSFERQLELYVRNAALLARTLSKRGLRFTLLTNDEARVRISAARGHMVLDIESIPFETQVPRGVLFYSAHFKFDAYRHLSSQSPSYLCLCDLDMVCTRALPDVFERLVSESVPMRYDITEQVATAFGESTIRRDLETLHLGRSTPHWSGGEFLAGPPGFFAKLVDAIENIYPRYVAALDRLHHVGDECVTSAAIEVLMESGVRIVDAGRLGLVSRYWSIPTRHRQVPLRERADTMLLHLPADKVLLAKMATTDGSTDDRFLEAYRSALVRSPWHWLRWGKVAIDNVFRSPSAH